MLGDRTAHLKMFEVDKMLERCGDWNCLQWILMALFCIINLLSAMHYYSHTIISFVPRFWCSDGLDETLGEPAGLPVKWSYNTNCLPLNSTASGEKCSKYAYQLYKGYQSFTSEVDWVCDEAWKLTLGQSIFFVGSVIGSLLFGYLADVLGRVPIMIVANLVAMLGNTLTIFGTTLVKFCLFRFISGMATDSNFVMMYILVMEYVRPSLRTVSLSLCIGIFYCLGSMSAPWIAVYMQSWRGFLLVTSVPFLVVPFYIFIVPESVQWLVSKKKYERAVKYFKRVATINRRHVEPAVYDEFVQDMNRRQQLKKKEPNLIGLFMTPRLRRNTLILFFKSMVITLCYDAVSRNVQGLGISPFVMFTLSATTILPACLTLIALQDRIGRKAMASTTMLLSGIFISVTGVILYKTDSDTKRNSALLVTLSVIGRFGVTVAYNSGAQYATELIPTCVRGQGVAAVHVMGYAFTFFSSYILYTRSLFEPLPEIILGFISLVGASLCLLLPETLNKTLPATLEDGENFGKNEHWYSFVFLKQRSSSVDVLATNAAPQARL